MHRYAQNIMMYTFRAKGDCHGGVMRDEVGYVNQASGEDVFSVLVM